jgi:hypothetical protein
MIVEYTTPFLPKKQGENKLFRRKKGFKSSEIADGSTGTIEIIVPFPSVKINELEIVNGKEGAVLDFKVHDTPTGTISTVPNLMLNQFGFDVELPDGFYRDRSEYDADLIQDMKIIITVKNNTGSPYTCRGNIVFHEVK